MIVAVCKDRTSVSMHANVFLSNKFVELKTYQSWYVRVPYRWATHRPRHWSTECRVWCRGRRSSAARLWWKPAGRRQEPLKAFASSVMLSQQVFTFLRLNERWLMMDTDLPNRIVRGVDDDGLCLGVEFTGKLIWIEIPVGACDCLLSRFLKHCTSHFVSWILKCILKQCSRWSKYLYHVLCMTSITSFRFNSQGVAVSTQVWPRPFAP